MTEIYYPQEIWNIIKDYAGISLKDTVVHYGSMTLCEVGENFYTWIKDKKTQSYIDRLEDLGWETVNLEIKFRRIYLDARYYKNEFGSSSSLWTFYLPKYSKYRKIEFTVIMPNRTIIKTGLGEIIFSMDHFVEDEPIEKVPTCALIKTLPVKFARKYAKVLFLKA